MAKILRVGSVFVQYGRDIRLYKTSYLRLTILFPLLSAVSTKYAYNTWQFGF